MSPAQISVCVWYHGHCEDMPRLSDEMAKGLILLGMLAKNERVVEDGDTSPRPAEDFMNYIATDRLHAYVEMLKQVPLPVSAWVHPSYKIQLESH